MKSLKNVIFAVLALVLALCLSGCVAEPPAPTTLAPTPTTTEPTTEPPLDVAALYSDAAAAAAAAADLSLIQSKTVAVTAGGETFTSTEEYTLSYTGRGTETAAASATGKVDYDGETAGLTEIFAEGKSYVTLSYYLGNFQYQAEGTSDDFLGRYLPPVLLDGTLYGSITHEETSAGYTLSFSDATAIESWMGLPEDAVLQSAEGTATLDSNGKLKDSTYSLTYSIAGVTYSFHAQQELYSTVTVKNAPANTESYLVISHPDVPKWFVKADGHLLQTQSVSSHISKLVLTAAGGASLIYSTDVEVYGSGADVMAKVEQDINQTDYSTNTKDSFNMVELYKNGKYTSSTNGGAPEKNAGVNAEIMLNYTGEKLLENIPYIYDLTSAELTDLGGSVIIEFTLTEDYGKAVCSELCALLFNDEGFLDNLATSYAVDKLEGYIAFDKYSGLLTAVGTNYSASHTIYGQPYVLQQQIDQSFKLASLDSYEAITEETSPDAEPEVAPTPLFYKVTGQNGQTMWLLGTIHVGDNRTGHLPQAIWDAFNSADALAVECDTEAFDERAEEDEKIQELLSEAYFYSDGTTTKDHIEDEELYTYALRMLKCSGNYNFNGLYFKPSVWSSTFDSFYLQQGYQLLSDKGVDHRLLLKAKDMGKPIYEVESSEFQIQMLNGWSEELMEFLLAENCSYDYPEYCASVLELYEAWLAGDEAVLAEMLSDEEDTSEMTEEELKEYEKYKDLLEEYNNAMGPERNDDMLKKAIEYLESGETVFYAVGLAHLLAEDGLVYTLRDAGYTVELVSYE